MRLAAAMAIALAAPFPSKVRYAPVARGFWAVLTEVGGDVGMGYVLFGSCFYFALYSAISFGLIKLAENLIHRARAAQ